MQGSFLREVTELCKDHFLRKVTELCKDQAVCLPNNESYRQTLQEKKCA